MFASFIPPRSALRISLRPPRRLPRLLPLLTLILLAACRGPESDLHLLVTKAPIEGASCVVRTDTGTLAARISLNRLSSMAATSSVVR